MAVAFDTVSESHSASTGSVSEAAFSWTHTPVSASPRGVLIFVNTISASNFISSITYGGVAASVVANASATDTSTEIAGVGTYFLSGSTMPTAAASVVVNRTNNATAMYATAMTITGANYLEVAGSPVLSENNAAYTELDVNSGTYQALRFAAAYYGANGFATAGSSTTSTGSAGQIDWGAYTFTTAYEQAAGSGLRRVGFDVGADDRAGVYLAIYETPLPVAPGALPIFMQYYKQAVYG